MDKQALSKILAEHKLWLDNKGGKQADLIGADLSRADLIGADLRGANLNWVNLSGTNLSGANLICLNLGPWQMIISQTHVHIGCERFSNDKTAEKTMRILAKNYKMLHFLPLYLEAYRSAKKLMALASKVKHPK